MFLEPSNTQMPATHAEPEHEATRHRRSWRFGVGIVLGALILLGFGVYVAIAGTKIVQGSVAAREALYTAKADISDADFSKALDELSRAKDGVLTAKSGAKMVPFAAWIPWVGPRYAAGLELLDATEKTVDVLRDAVSIASDVASVVADARETLSWKDPTYATMALHDFPASVKRALFVRLADALPDLRAMQVKLDLAHDDIVTIQSIPEAGALADMITPFVDVVDELKTSVDFMVPFAGIAREFAGLRGDRQFLLMFMNDTELRPTGGFLGSYGLLVIRDGDMKQLSTDDTYAVDTLAAASGEYAVTSPAPIATYLEQPVWYFRDGTWSPDFPTGAQETVSLFRQEFAAAGKPVPQIDGVIGITTGFLERVLDYVGAVTVNGVTYTGTSAADVLEYQVEVGFEDQGVLREDRKDVVGELTNAIMDKLLETSPAQFGDIFTLLTQGFAEKSIAMFSTDAETQAVLDNAQWSGRVTSRSTDTLMVVDANLASLKSDPVVDRTISYSIAPTASGYRATASITYKHTGSFDWKTSRYRTYTRIYVPEGSSLVSVDGSLANDAIRNPSGAAGEVTTSQEFGLTSFGTFTSVEPGQSRTLTFVYDLPASVTSAIQSGTYTLTTLKQMGADARNLVLHLNFGKPIHSASVPEESSLWGDSIYDLSTVLSGDADFHVTF